MAESCMPTAYVAIESQAHRFLARCANHCTVQLNFKRLHGRIWDAGCGMCLAPFLLSSVRMVFMYSAGLAWCQGLGVVLQRVECIQI